MKRVTINAGIDTCCLVTFIPSLITGLVLFLVLPSGGGRGGGGVAYLGISRPEWVNLHNITSLAFAALLVIHLMLHWRFFRNIRKTIGRKTTGPSDIPE